MRLAFRGVQYRGKQPSCSSRRDHRKSRCACGLLMRGVRSCRLQWKWSVPRSTSRRSGFRAIPTSSRPGRERRWFPRGYLVALPVVSQRAQFVCVQSPMASRSVVKWRICFRARLLNNLSPIKSGSEVRSYRSMTSGFRLSGLRYNRATKAKNDSTPTHL